MPKNINRLGNALPKALGQMLICLTIVIAFVVLHGSAEAALDSGLVAYYPFNGNASDASGNNYNGTVSGTIAYGTDRFGNPNSAAVFNGTDTFIATPSLDFAGSNTVSISLWVKANQQLDSAVYYFATSGSDGFGVWQESNSIGLAISLPSTNSALGPITFGSWSHFVGTYDGSTIRAYINGQLVQITGWPGVPNNLNSPVTFGYFTSSNPYNYWSGSLDDVRIYNRVLTSDEVMQLYSGASFSREQIGNMAFCTETDASGCPQTMYVCPSTTDCNTCISNSGNRCGNVALSGVNFGLADLLYLGGDSFGGGSLPVCKTTDFITSTIAYRCVEGKDYCFACGAPDAIGGSNSILPVIQPTTTQERFEFQGNSVLMCADTRGESGCFESVYSCDSQVPWPTTSLSNVTFGLGELKYVGGESDGLNCDVANFVTTQCIFRCYTASNNCFSYCPE